MWTKPEAVEMRYGLRIVGKADMTHDVAGTSNQH